MIEMFSRFIFIVGRDLPPLCRLCPAQDAAGQPKQAHYSPFFG
jgi:hypothetical protein